jgi:hypothetical protein
MSHGCPSATHHAAAGIQHKAINPIELAMQAVQHMQNRFYKDFPPLPEEVGRRRVGGRAQL